MQKGKKRRARNKNKKKNRGRRMRKRSKECETKIVILAAYLACLLVFSLVLQLEVAVQSHYEDTA